MKQLEDLFQSFSAMSPEEQIAKIRQVRHTRTIERPAAAVKRVKKEKKKVEKTKDKAKVALSKLSPAQREQLIKLMLEKQSDGK